MLAVAEEIRADLEHVTAYLTAAAIGIAREMGEHMLLRRPVDVDGATEFATALLLAGVREIAAK